jgi:hypothetical protein
MTKRVTRIAPWQAGKFFAVLYFIMGLLFAIPIAFFSAAAGGYGGYGIGIVIALPFMYAIGGLIFVPIACWVFNLVAKFVGGLDFEVTDH